MRQKLLPLVLSVVAALGMYFGYRLHESLEQDLVKYLPHDQLNVVTEAYGIIRSNFYGDLDTLQYSEAIVTQATNSLDQYSTYISPVKLNDFNHVIHGAYIGLGFDYMSFNDSTVIIDVLSGSPAEMAGISRGDVLLEVSGPDSTSSIDHQMISHLVIIDTAHLKLYRPSEDKTYNTKLSKGLVENSPIESKILQRGTIGYIKIKRFSDGVFLAFMDELEHYKNNGLEFKKLIIDLRNNPGGLLNETVKILNQLIPEANQTMLSTINNRGKRKDYKSNGRSFLNIQDIVVLINESSASASEILAGSLQDLNLATIVGTNSYGKGLIQQHFELSNGGTINLTIGEYLLPSGRRIVSNPTDDPMMRGIVPDHAVDHHCESAKGRFYEQYAFLWGEGKIQKKYLSAQEFTQLMNAYRNMPSNQSGQNLDCKLYKLSSLLWSAYQSELDLNDQLVQYDHDIMAAIDILNQGVH